MDPKIEIRGRARVASARSTLGRTWRFDRPPPLNPAAFGSAYAFGRFSCVGELLSLAISSNSPHTPRRPVPLGMFSVTVFKVATLPYAATDQFCRAPLGQAKDSWPSRHIAVTLAIRKLALTFDSLAHRVDKMQSDT